MTHDNTQKLFNSFPSLYRGRVKSVQKSLMSIGFDCGDGWFGLIWTLSQKIENAARQAGLEPQSNAWPEVTQVKQKMGTLRFYLENPTETMTALICKAEQDSEKTCETCGNPGSTVRGFGVKTQCEMHGQEKLLESLIVRQTPDWRCEKD
jgi:hypothetical protein